MRTGRPPRPPPHRLTRDPAHSPQNSSGPRSAFHPDWIERMTQAEGDAMRRNSKWRTHARSAVRFVRRLQIKCANRVYRLVYRLVAGMGLREYRPFFWPTSLPPQLHPIPALYTCTTLPALHTCTNPSRVYSIHSSFERDISIIMYSRGL